MCCGVRELILLKSQAFGCHLRRTDRRAYYDTSNSALFSSFSQHLKHACSPTRPLLRISPYRSLCLSLTRTASSLSPLVLTLLYLPFSISSPELSRDLFLLGVECRDFHGSLWANTSRGQRVRPRSGPAPPAYVLLLFLVIRQSLRHVLTRGAGETEGLKPLKRPLAHRRQRCHAEGKKRRENSPIRHQTARVWVG